MTCGKCVKRFAPIIKRTHKHALIFKAAKVLIVIFGFCALAFIRTTSFCEISSTALMRHVNWRLLYFSYVLNKDCLFYQNPDNPYKAILPIHYAIYFKKDALLELIINNMNDLNKDDGKGNTPLNFSAKVGNIAAMKYILERGADIDAKSRYGETALSSAARRCRFSSVKFLIKHGADKNTVAKWGDTPLSYANHCKDKRIRYLILLAP